MSLFNFVLVNRLLDCYIFLQKNSYCPLTYEIVISQWAIFAIRNLLENNTQNQNLVASLEQRGTADYSALKELGFLVEERDGSLLLKPVRKDS